MKRNVIAVWAVVLGALMGSAAAQDWSSWTEAKSNWFLLGKHKGVQYRWRVNTPNGGDCLVQLRDTLRQANQTTVVSVQIDYQSHDAESTRDVVTITDVKGENAGETTVHQCTSVGDVRLTDIARR